VELPILARLSELGVTELPALQGVDVFIAPQGGLHSRGDKIMNLLGRAFRMWCRRHKVEKPPACWDMHLFGRGANDTANAYPVLDSSVKASHTKPIIFWLAELAKDIATHCKCHLVT
jgi:hypothetical protein